MSVFIEIIAWFVFINWQIYTVNSRQWYDRARSKIKWPTPPGWVFGVVWPLLYAVLTAFAVVLFGDNDNLIALFVLFTANILLNKIWSLVFFGQKQRGLGAAIIAVMIGTEIAILILVILENYWVALGLFIPYVVWTIYAFILNIQFL